MEGKKTSILEKRKSAEPKVQRHSKGSPAPTPKFKIAKNWRARRSCAKTSLSLKGVQEELLHNGCDTTDHFLNFPVTVWVRLSIEERAIIKK
jgi:hypothetical protein